MAFCRQEFHLFVEVRLSSFAMHPVAERLAMPCRIAAVFDRLEIAPKEKPTLRLYVNRMTGCATYQLPATLLAPYVAIHFVID